MTWAVFTVFWRVQGFLLRVLLEMYSIGEWDVNDDFSHIPAKWFTCKKKCCYSCKMISCCKIYLQILSESKRTTVRKFTSRSCNSPENTSGDRLGGGFNYFLFSPRKLEKMSNLTHIFQIGWWDHQLVIRFFTCSWGYLSCTCCPML